MGLECKITAAMVRKPIVLFLPHETFFFSLSLCETVNLSQTQPEEQLRVFQCHCFAVPEDWTLLCICRIDCPCTIGKLRGKPCAILNSTHCLFTELWADALLSGVTSCNGYVLTGCCVVAGDAWQTPCTFASYALLHVHVGRTSQTAEYVFKTTVLPQWKGTVLLSSLRKNFI